MEDEKTRAISHSIRRPLESPSTQIRLLLLHPGDEQDAIHCAVSIWRLSEAPKFSAISYTWGPLEPEAYIYLSASADAERQALKVRENARYALWQVRLRRPGAYVWIDSVCIDQESLVEKGAQVAAMSDIYSTAHEVFACLGPADEASDAVEEACHDIDGTVQEAPDDYDYYLVEQSSWRPPKGEADLTQFYHHWNTFSDRPYFHRLWIVQELYYSRSRFSLLCGIYTLSWSCLQQLQYRLSFWTTWRRLVMTSENSMKSLGLCSASIKTLDFLIHFTLRWTTDRPNLDFEQLVQLTRKLACEDPRDRVYGTLGLVGWEQLGIETPIPNYDISPLDLAHSLLPRIATNIQLAWLLLEMVGARLSIGEEWIAFGRRIQSHLQVRAEPRTEPWYATAHGLCAVQQDMNGRLSVDLKQGKQSEFDSQVLQLLHSSPETLGDLPLPFSRTHPPVKLYTGEEVSALAWPGVRQGDIILTSIFIDVVLRRSDVEGQFYVVGRVLLLNGYQANSLDEWTCGCWSHKPGFSDRLVCVALPEVSDTDVLLYTALQDWSDPGSRVQQLSLDFPPLGSMVRCHSETPWQPHQSIRPLETSCTVHDAQQGDRWRHNEFEFALASGCGMCVQVNE